jgi:hypothetical protein
MWTPPINEADDFQGAGAGRGIVNPPLAFEIQSTQEKNKSQAEKARTELTSAIPVTSLIVGAGRGATAGLVKYLAGAALIGTRSISGGAPLTWQESLDEAQRIYDVEEQSHPIATTIGKIAGSIAGPGQAIAKGVGAAVKLGAASTIAPKIVAPVAGTLAATAGNATQGAIQASSNNENIGTGAAIGAGTGLAGSIVGGSLNYALNKAGNYLRDTQNSILQEYAKKAANAWPPEHPIAQLFKNIGEQSAKGSTLLSPSIGFWNAAKDTAASSGQALGYIGLGYGVDRGLENLGVPSTLSEMIGSSIGLGGSYKAVGKLQKDVIKPIVATRGGNIANAISPAKIGDDISKYSSAFPGNIHSSQNQWEPPSTELNAGTWSPPLDEEDHQ